MTPPADTVNPSAMSNRRSDLLFVMARVVDHRAGQQTRPGKQRLPRRCLFQRSASDRVCHACEQLRRARTMENFPSRHGCCQRRYARSSPLSTRMRASLRTREGDPAPRRTDRLRRWQQRLHEAVTMPSAPSDADSSDTMIGGRPPTRFSHNLPLPLFDDLISAFAQDITTKRYQSWVELFDYCRRSANPWAGSSSRLAVTKARRWPAHPMPCARRCN